jgi:hypothetical protein
MRTDLRDFPFLAGIAFPHRYRVAVTTACSRYLHLLSFEVDPFG